MSKLAGIKEKHMRTGTFLVVFLLLLAALLPGCDESDYLSEKDKIYKAAQAHYKGKWYSAEYCFMSADIFATENIYEEGSKIPENPNDSPALICEVKQGNKITFYYYKPDGSGPFKGNTYSTRPHKDVLPFSPFIYTCLIIQDLPPDKFVDYHIERTSLQINNVCSITVFKSGDKKSAYYKKLFERKKTMRVHYQGKWYSDEYCFMSADIYEGENIYVTWPKIPKNPNNVPALICEVIYDELKWEIIFYYYNPDGFGPFKGVTYLCFFGFDRNTDYILSFDADPFYGELYTEGDPIEATFMYIKNVSDLEIFKRKE